jgi:hypothetical protein
LLCTVSTSTCSAALPLLALQVNNPHKLLPPKCFNTATLLQGQDEADAGDWAAVCKAAAASPSSSCAAITKQQPLYTCSYESLSSFYQIQRHIRIHGAVITRWAC